MIFVDEKKIEFTNFPDGTSSFRFMPKMDFAFFLHGENCILHSVVV